MVDIIRATLAYGRWSWLAMYSLPLLLLGPFLWLAPGPQRMLFLTAFLLFFFAAFGWVWLLSGEDRERRLVLHGALPLDRRTIALSRQLITLIHMLPGLFLATVLTLWAHRLEGIDGGESLRFLVGGTGLLFCCNQVALLAEELKYLALRSKFWSVVIGSLTVPMYILAFSFLISSSGSDDQFAFFHVVLEPLRASLPLSVTLHLVALALAALAVTAFERRSSLESLPWVGLDGWFTKTGPKGL